MRTLIVRAARDLGNVMIYALSNSRMMSTVKKLGVPVLGEISLLVPSDGRGELAERAGGEPIG